MMNKNEFVWEKGSTIVQFSNPAMTFFDDVLVDKKVSRLGIEDVMYYYYTVTMTNGLIKKEFQVGDFPKVPEIPIYIDHLLNLNMNQEGVVLEEIEREGFYRKVQYHQTMLNDPFGLFAEYFLKFERYDYTVKQPDQEGEKFFSEYRLLIGNPMNPSSGSNCADCFYFHGLTTEDLIRLKEVVESFIAYSLDYSFQQELKWMNEEKKTD